MSSHGRKHGRSGGPDPGRLLAVISQDWNVSGGIGIFNLAASSGCECSLDEAAEENAVGNIARGIDRSGGRVERAAKRNWRTRPVALRFHRPSSFGAGNSTVAAGL